MTRHAALARRRELLAATAALQRLRLGIGLRMLDARCVALDGAARPWLGLGALLLPLAAALGARPRGAVGKLLRMAAAWRLLARLRRRR